MINIKNLLRLIGTIVLVVIVIATVAFFLYDILNKQL